MSCALCVLQALGETDFAGVLRQLLPLMKPRGEEGSSSESSSGSRSGEDECGPDELLVLLVYLYSLAGEAQPADDEEVEKVERELIGALTLVVTKRRSSARCCRNSPVRRVGGRGEGNCGVDPG